MTDKVLGPQDLGRLVRERREAERISLRDAAQEANISFNTLARIEKGHVPDIATFQRVADWLGRSPGEFFGPSKRSTASTPDAIAQHLRTDPALTEEAADRIARILSELYLALARNSATTAVHLRSARALRADAAVLLGDLVQTMQRKLETENAAR